MPEEDTYLEDTLTKRKHEQDLRQAEIEMFQAVTSMANSIGRLANSLTDAIAEAMTQFERIGNEADRKRNEERDRIRAGRG